MLLELGLGIAKAAQHPPVPWHLHPERQRATSGAIRQKNMSLWGANP